MTKKISVEEGYKYLLNGNKNEAKKIFAQMKDYNPRASWAYILIQFIDGYVTTLPSYFQVRNFLEIDINLLINSGQNKFVENIINGDDLFYQTNPESYKFIARVLINNGFPTVAFYYLKKGKNVLYNDPELHLMLAKCYLSQKNIDSAKDSVNVCLSILPKYYPAKILLKEIEKLELEKEF